MSADAKHTPGPWTVRPLGDLFEVIGPMGEVLAAFDNEPDATLSAAGPVLADALAKCRGLFSEIRGDWTDPREQCREGWRVIDEVLRVVRPDLYVKATP